MKKRFGILFGFLMLALVDSVLSFAMPIDFTYHRLSVVWHFYFIGLLVFVRDKPWINRILIGLLAGLVSDLFFTDSYPFCFFVYPLFAWLVGLPKRRMDGSEFAWTIYLICCFALDWFPWLWEKLSGQNNVSLFSWLYHIELITILTSGLTVILVMYVDIVMDRFYLIQKHRQKKEEQKHRSRKKLASVPSANHPKGIRRS